MIYIHNDDWRTSYRKAGAIIIPMSGRYTYFLDRNKSAVELQSLITPNMQWLLNQYLGKFTQDECVKTVGHLNNLTNTYALEKNVTTVLKSTCCNLHVRPTSDFIKSFDTKPEVISLNVAANAFCFDSRSYNNDHTELICEDNKKIESSIIRALTLAINSLRGENNHIYITPLFKNNIYMPKDKSKINSAWDYSNYINSLMMLLSKYNLDRYKIHMFIRTAPGVDQC